MDVGACDGRRRWPLKKGSDGGVCTCAEESELEVAPCATGIGLTTPGFSGAGILACSTFGRLDS